MSRCMDSQNTIRCSSKEKSLSGQEISYMMCSCAADTLEIPVCASAPSHHGTPLYVAQYHANHKSPWT